MPERRILCWNRYLPLSEKLCFYTINYGPIYISEIYHFLGKSKLLEKNFGGSPINVLSLGCGFGPDFIALSKYIYDNRLNIRVCYDGFDEEQNWLHITNGIIPNIPQIANILNGFTLTNYHIIFLNKFFSTLLKSGNARQFLDLIINEIRDNMQNGSFIIFNDINHFKMGRDIFDNRVNMLLQTKGRYFYNVGGAYNNNYIEIERTNNICQIPDGLPISPKLSPTKTVFFLYKKTYQ